MYIAAVYRKTDLIGTAFEGILDHVDFPAGFQTENATAPYHGNTCDSCHIRNGGGIPLMPNGLLPQIHVARGMNENFIIHPDYTYSNKPPLPSMKMVLFDLPYKSEEPDSCGGNEAPQSDPVALAAKQVYSNKIMNFFGDSFHVNQINKQNQTVRLPFYTMSYEPISADDGFEVVDSTLRGDAPHFTRQRAEHFTPQRVAIDNIQIGSGIACQKVSTDKPDSVADENWPKSCDDVDGPMIEQTIKDHKIGFMHLLGRRLGNTPMIEMIPDQTILATQQMQVADMTYAGSYLLAPGTRTGSNGQTHYRSCTSGKVGDQSDDCYISRWGWIGDRASLEDQIANAAHVEMNVTSKEGYDKFHKNEATDKHLVRYDETLCGPADLTCQESDANSDITEQEIKDMATYQRWIGIPNRSEYQVSSGKVQMGEKIFKQLHCDSCHVIKKIAFIEHDNMLPDEERAHLKKLQNPAADQPDYPFISYLGTDLLIHDMGYLSQIAKAPDNVKIRNADGTIKNECRAYIQKIRTPALKGLRFNRFVTDSNHNTTAPLDNNNGETYKAGGTIIPGCDFLLHDGRACDAIQAAYLHDGPAIKKLGIIAALNKLSKEDLMFLRAFLYSL